MDSRARWRNLLEPPRLVAHFLGHPPDEFLAWSLRDATPAFSAPLDPFLTADAATQRWLQRIPGARRLRRWLRMRTCFIGTTVSEYALLPRDTPPAAFVRELLDMQAAGAAGNHALTIVKDLPLDSPLLDHGDNAYATALAEALRAAGFALLAGQALAYVPVDYASIDDYLARLSHARRRDIRRKLRSRRDLAIEVVPTGPAFEDLELQRQLYRLYVNVYAQSALQFDRLSRDFLVAVLRDGEADGRVFLYRHAGRVIGFNLCFPWAGNLVDKYVGFEYPAAREHNLYTVSWMENLAFAAANGLAHFIAGWTDPVVKAQLGARFTFTRHAVYARNPLLRGALHALCGRFEGDRDWYEGRARAPDRP